MSHRHLSRSVAMQSLFEWDMKGGALDAPALEEIAHHNSVEFAPGLPDATFVTSLLEGVQKHRTILDDIIVKAAPDWPLAQISVVDRNILRLGLYELLYANRTEVPAKVAINEAIELAKTFGGETSGKFVNGVLGNVYKELGEPGKDEVGKKRPRRDELVDLASLPIEKKAGAMVYTRGEKETYLAFVHDIFGRWTLSKGSIEEGEDGPMCARREVKEEMGIDVEIEEFLAENTYLASHPEKGKIRKQVLYYLAHAPHKDKLVLKESGGLDDVGWFPLSEVSELALYDDIVPLLTKGLTMIVQKQKQP